MERILVPKYPWVFQNLAPSPTYLHTSDSEGKITHQQFILFKGCCKLVSFFHSWVISDLGSGKEKYRATVAGRRVEAVPNQTVSKSLHLSRQPWESVFSLTETPKNSHDVTSVKGRSDRKHWWVTMLRWPLRVWACGLTQPSDSPGRIAKRLGSAGPEAPGHCKAQRGKGSLWVWQNFHCLCSAVWLWADHLAWTPVSEL
jgi:hypothetical protein